MTEHNDVRASREEVEAFVGKLRGFHGELDEPGQAMLGTILEGAQAGETGGYKASRWGRYQDPTDQDKTDSESSSGWDDLIGWIEEQGEEDTQGFMKKPRK